jgi:predicted GNAT family acetyltransferase
VIRNKQIKGRNVFVEMDGNIMAKWCIPWPSPDKMIIEHTEVSEELKGKNVGNQLVHTAVEYARTNISRSFPLSSRQFCF